MPEPASEERLDAIAGAFAAVIDAKTPFTYRHSRNVAHYSTAIGTSIGIGSAAARDLLRAGLLHDIGKLGVSNRILDKPSGLTESERAEIGSIRCGLRRFSSACRISSFRVIGSPAPRAPGRHGLSVGAFRERARCERTHSRRGRCVRGVDGRPPISRWHGCGTHARDHGAGTRRGVRSRRTRRCARARDGRCVRAHRIGRAR